MIGHFANALIRADGVALSRLGSRPLLQGRRALRDTRGARDMALLLIGFAGGFRRSELAAFDLRDVSFSAEGLVLFVGRSKADQERHGAEVGIEAVPDSPLCAVTALRRWLEVRSDAPGALYAASTAAAT